MSFSILLKLVIKYLYYTIKQPSGHLLHFLSYYKQNISLYTLFKCFDCNPCFQIYKKTINNSSNMWGWGYEELSLVLNNRTKTLLEHKKQKTCTKWDCIVNQLHENIC